MKKVISLAALLCAFAGSALASTPEVAIKALNLGNEKYILEQSLKPAPLVMVVADEAIAQEPASLFGLAADQIGTVRTPFADKAGLSVRGADLVAPLVVILGLDEGAVWSVYALTLQASPDLIHAVLKGQVAAQGAVLDPATGAVKLLGAHPDQSALVGRYLLGLEPNKTDDSAAPAATNPAETDAPADRTEPAVEQPKDAPAKTEQAPVAQTPPAAEAGLEPARDPASSSGGGSVLLVLAIAGIVGAVIVLDKTVLRPEQQ